MWTVLVTQDLLEQAVIQKALKAHDDFKRNGYIETQVLIFRSDMTQSADVQVAEPIANTGAFREILKKMVEQECPEAVLAIYQAEVDINYGGLDPVTEFPRDPKRKMIIRIEASSPVANYEMVFVYGKHEDRYVFEHDVYIPPPNEGVRAYPRFVEECELNQDREHYKMPHVHGGD